MTHSTKAHGGYATAGRRRGETYLQCNVCGQRAHPRFQAGPRELEPAIPLVRFANVLLASVLLWLGIIAFGLSVLS